MSESIFIPLEFVYTNKTLQNVLQAHLQKMDKYITSPDKIVKVLEKNRINNNHIQYKVQRTLPQFAIRFFNLNHIVYFENIKIKDDSKIEIVSEQSFGKINMKSNLVFSFNDENKSTVCNGFIKTENCPKILKKVVTTYSKKTFTAERQNELDLCH